MKVKYTETIECERHENQERVQLVKDWCFTIDNREIWVPATYDFNGASIPRAVWPVIGSPFSPSLWEPAAAHDWLYLTHLVSRSVADEVLYQLCLQNKINTVKAHVIWGTLRVFGRFIGWPNRAPDKAELGKINKILSQRQDGKKFLN